KSSIVLFSVGNRIDIQWSIPISKVAGRAASRRASVDFPAAIFPQRRYKVVGRAASIVAEYQLSTLGQLVLWQSRRFLRACRVAITLRHSSWTRLHSLGFDYFAGVGRAQKIEEDLRCLGILYARR